MCVVSDLGLGTLALRDIARDRSVAKKYMGNIIAIKLILAVITFGFIGLIINLMHEAPQTVNVVYLITLYVVVGSLVGTFNSLFQAFQRMEYVSIGRILSAILMLVLSVIALQRGAGVVAFAFIYFLVNLIILIYSMLISAWFFLKPGLDIDWAFWRSSIQEALPFCITSLSIVVYYHIDKVMLSLMVDNTSVGYYNSAYNLVMSLLFFYSAFSASVFPLMSYFYPISKEAFMQTFERSVKYLWIVALPIGVGTTLLAGKIVEIIYGPSFAPAVIALQILVWAHVIIYMNAYANILNNINKQSLVTRQTIICAILNISLNVILIPRYSYIGASVATVLTELSAFLILNHYVSKTEFGFPWRKFSVLFLKILVSCAVMAIAIEYLININIILLILVGAAVYFAVICIEKGLDSEDVGFVIQLLGNRKLVKR
ncbi:putative flippase AglR [uncultured archaeon]|nr:putative flippase AglR [uncultured archaeon]